MQSTKVSVRRGERVQDAPKVSVIIPAYKPAWLDAALDSVRAQTFRSFEIIVVDDGSPEAILPARADDVVLVRQPNAGPGGARNQGVLVARGELIAMLDADDIMSPTKLERQVAFHDAHPGAVMSCTDFVLLEGSARRQAPPLRQRVPVSGDEIPYESLFYENCIVCSTVMLRRAAYLKTAGMKPHCRCGEDYGLWLRVALQGPIGYVDEPLLERRLHEESLMARVLSDGTWYAQERDLYDEFLREHPELRSQQFVAAALARLEFQGAWSHMNRGEWSDARRALQRSLSHNPMQPKAWFDFARAMFHVGRLRGTGND